MKRANRSAFAICALFLSVPGIFALFPSGAGAAVMNDYCVQPPFVTQSVPPLVMFLMDRSHKLYYQAYNDASDIDEDGQLDITYKHSIDYYGYFDYNKCYTYSSTGTGQFTPASYSTLLSSNPNVYDKFCSSGQWSGNVLNWLSMSRYDVLKKVLYGGHRITDSNTQTVLERAFIPQDAHSWGKELTGKLCNNGSSYTYSCSDTSECATGHSCVDKSVNLIGISAAGAAIPCTATVPGWGGNNKPGKDKMLVAKYTHANTRSGSDHADLLASYEPSNLVSFSFVTDFNDTILNPSNDHGDYYNYIAVAQFNVESSKRGNWQFAVDGDDGVEVEIDGQVVASYYGAHGACGCQTRSGTINLSASGYHTLVARHSEISGQDGVKVWYKRPGDSSWTIFGSSSNLTIKSPNIVAGTNECTIKNLEFITTGQPSATATTGVPGRRHLFCSTTLTDGGTPVMRLLPDMTNRIWEWSAKERPVCDNSLGTPTDYTVRVEVCNTTVGVEPNCKNYSGTYKPNGLLQKYGEGDGTKLCSKTMSKSCSSDADCGSGEGICLDKAAMYFGLMTGTNEKNLSGGVIRKNFGSITDETNMNNGLFQTSENVQGNIIITLDRLKIVGYRYSDFSYQDSSGGSCGWITSRALNEGECRMWGNPIAEMMYETLRYIAGKGAPTAEFTYSGTQDAGLQLSKPSWGRTKGGTTYQPYEIYPTCSKPFILILSDINPNYDSDQVPGSSFAKNDGSFFSEDNLTPQLGIGTVTSGASLLNQLTDNIGTQEAIAGASWFIGENSSVRDFVCTSKSVTKLSLLRGLCSEEPTKKGGFYTAALAYYGHTLLKSKTGKPDVTTYAVALSSPVGNIKVKSGSNFVTIVPTAKSVSGGSGVDAACSAKCTLTIDSNGVHISNCASDAFCPTNQIVNMFVKDLFYNNSYDLVYAKFSINFEDVEQGADHDMDAIADYEICTQAAVDAGQGSCGGSLGTGVEVKLVSAFAAGGIDQALGFVISGTTEDGVYLPIKDKDVGGSSPINSLPLNWSHTFTPSGTAAGFLKNPLWYAAKWGGYTDTNGNNVTLNDGTKISKPDIASEWDKDGNGDPDNYYLVVNPLKLEQQLDKALTDILTRVSSGTAASILSNNDNNGANLLQAIFYPKKNFEADEVSWIGELQDLWYYIDPFLQSSTIREDSVGDKKLKLKQDYATTFYFDTSVNQTRVKRYLDSDGNGSGETLVDTVAAEDVRSLWKAGNLLWARDLSASPRTMYTSSNGTSLLAFTTANNGTLQSLLQASSTTEADSIINYIRGTDQTGYRSRTVSINGVSGVWRLGDIISSTPRLQSSVKLNTYNLKAPNGYNDASYGAYTLSTDYLSRGMAFAGANDGMLHAFNLGVLTKGTTTGETSVITGANLGKEMWTFIPKNALPYLKYLADPTYNHLYYVDASPYLADASIAVTTGCTIADYWNCDKKTTYSSGTTLSLSDTSWRTVLIGGMGLGGASRNSTDTCSAATECVKAPINGVGYSSYFALNVTDPTTPTMLWEFSDPALGYSTSGQAVVRVGDYTKNGRWFAVFASGPTGPINTTTHQFMGTSNQNLKVFIVDLVSGTLVRTIDTGIQNAFAGTLTGGTLDSDRWNPTGSGYYKDDAVYFGYTQKDTSTNTWTKGGVLRLLTRENTTPVTTDFNPSQWAVSTVIDNIGPVTSAVALLQDTTNKKLWLFFGTGRYYYKSGGAIDDADGQRALYGIKDPCYLATNKIDNSCSAAKIDPANLVDQSTSITTAIPADKNGWFINLDGADTNFKAERVITDPVAAPNGAVFFTTFKPSADICSFGGNSALWGVNFYNGGALPNSGLKGQAIIQVSTGAFEEVQFDPASGGGFTLENGRKTAEFQGVPPKNKPPVVSNAGLRPVKRIMHIQEK